MAYDASLYIHDMDRMAFAAINKFPVLVNLYDAYMREVDEKQERIHLLSTALKINENQYPEIHALLTSVCEKLGIDEPELFLVNSKDKNAWTLGSSKPILCLTTGIVKGLPSELLATVIAHECGHIACGHCLYHSMVRRLADGIDRNFLVNHPEIRTYLTPAMYNALQYWSRCSELSADRAAVLCDESADNSVELMLLLNGYKDVNRKAFLNQAKELEALKREDKSVKLTELFMTQEDSHPRLAVRALQCQEWTETEQFKGIVNGTWELPVSHKTEENETKELVQAEIQLEQVNPQDLNQINEALEQVEKKLDKYTCKASKADYAFSISSGILAGLLDSLFVGEFDLQRADQWGNEKVADFVMKIARSQGFKGDEFWQAIQQLENDHHLASDSLTYKFGGPSQHHFQDFTHHPTPVGLVFSILTQFTKKVYGTGPDGSLQSVPLSSGNYIGKSFSQKISFGILHWFFHMVSDMAGSHSSEKKGNNGMGLPGPVGAILTEMAALPVFHRNKPEERKAFMKWVFDLYSGKVFQTYDTYGNPVKIKFDLRTEIGIGHELGKQALRVILNEVLVRTFYFLTRLKDELFRIESFDDLHQIDLKACLPTGNRTIDRMLTISTMTFSVADTADAAVRAAVESGGDWVLFSGRFVTRFNYVGAGRSALAVVREISNEAKETQLIHEKMLLSEAKASIFLAQLQEFKVALDERVSDYLAEDITAFMEGFDDISAGIESGDSNLVIRGNITIQKVLGKESQFTSQEEFDDLMESDLAFQL